MKLRAERERERERKDNWHVPVVRCRNILVPKEKQIMPAIHAASVGVLIAFSTLFVLLQRVVLSQILSYCQNLNLRKNFVISALRFL